MRRRGVLLLLFICSMVMLFNFSEIAQINKLSDWATMGLLGFVLLISGRFMRRRIN
jgi:hypothetical protein